MEQQTLDALRQLLITMQNVGIGIVLAVIVGLMVIAFILFTRRQSKADANASKQFENVIGMLAAALKREDSETAKAIAPLVEIVAMVKGTMEQNTQAFLKNGEYRAETLAATKELALLQAENNTQVAALRDDMQKLPNTLTSAIDRVDINILDVVNGFGGLDENIREILKLVENNPEDHRHVLEALASLAIAQTKIFTLIDSRLPPSARTETPTPMRATLHPATEALRKRETDLSKAVKPEDTTPPDKDKSA